MEAEDRKNQAIADRMKVDFENGQDGCVRFMNKGVQYMYYRPLPINDWYLLTVAPASVLDSKMNAVLGRTYLLGVFMVLIFGGNPGLYSEGSETEEGRAHAQPLYG